jgi:hypothetical protein
VALDAAVLEVDAAGVALAGEVDAQDGGVGTCGAGEEGEDRVLGGARFDIAQGGAREERTKFLDELTDLSLVEIQLSSSSA